jgi:hypothetical protein
VDPDVADARVEELLQPWVGVRGGRDLFDERRVVRVERGGVGPPSDVPS